MNYQRHNLFLYFCYAAGILILVGCAPEIRRPLEICSGKGSVAEALSALQSHWQNMVSLKANGQCLLEFYVEGKQKPQKEKFSVKLLVNPPVEIYLQGDATLIPKAIILGSNEREFWLSIRPKEISTYWWGKWSQQDSSETLMINPKTLLEALGIAAVDAEWNWSLSNEGTFDILTKRQRGVVIKKIYVYSCDYLVKRIEYFDVDGQVAGVAELDKYKQVLEGFFVPAGIKIIKRANDNPEDSLSVTLDLKSIKSTEITAKQQNVLFNRPQPQGFKRLIRIVGGKWIEQRQ
ncbi:MAG: hypothetical protein ACYTBX_05340 [Planctomycetota bacterium]|jgi:hypothetical protein